MSDPARAEVVATAKTMAREGLVTGTAGNVSVRIGEKTLITPTRTPYQSMGEDDLVLVDAEGRRIEGSSDPSRELTLHLAIYRRRPDFCALVHTHSLFATAWSYLGEPLLPATEDIRNLGAGPIHTSPPHPAGSDELARTASAALGDSAGVLLGCHGLVAAGASLANAIDVARAIEHQSQIAWILRKGGMQIGV